MSRFPLLNTQRGATLVVGLIMLLVITLMVSSAFMLSSTNLKSVGNMQYRDEAIGAANVAIEQVISSSAIFITPTSQEIVVGSYSVNVAAPVCLYATEVVTNTSGDQNPNIYIEGSGGSSTLGFLDTQWEITATVNDGMSGTRVTTRQGIKITLPAGPNPCL